MILFGAAALPPFRRKPPIRPRFTVISGVQLSAESASSGPALAPQISGQENFDLFFFKFSEQESRCSALLSRRNTSGQSSGGLLWSPAGPATLARHVSCSPIHPEAGWRRTLRTPQAKNITFLIAPLGELSALILGLQNPPCRCRRPDGEFIQICLHCKAGVFLLCKSSHLLGIFHRRPLGAILTAV